MSLSVTIFSKWSGVLSLQTTIGTMPSEKSCIRSGGNALVKVFQKVFKVFKLSKWTLLNHTIGLFWQLTDLTECIQVVVVRIWGPNMHIVFIYDSCDFKSLYVAIWNLHTHPLLKQHVNPAKLWADKLSDEMVARAPLRWWILSFTQITIPFVYSSLRSRMRGHRISLGSTSERAGAV